MIEVRFFASLSSDLEDGRRGFQIEARPGLTVADVVHEVGLVGRELYVVVVNGRGARWDSTLEDGDRIGLFPPMSGG